MSTRSLVACWMILAAALASCSAVLLVLAVDAFASGVCWAGNLSLFSCLITGWVAYTLMRESREALR